MDSRCEIFALIIDDPIGTEPSDIVAIEGARRGNHAGAEVLGQLDGKASDAAGAAMDKNSLARAQPRRVLDGPERGEAGKRHGRRLDMTEARWFPRDDRRLDGDLFCVGAFLARLRHAKY